MTDTPKILGQLFPTNSQYATLYTVPVATNTIVSSITMCNIVSTGVGTIGSANVMVIPSTSFPTSGNVNLLYNGTKVRASDTFVGTIGLTLKAGDVVLVKSYAGNDIAFHIYGDEIT